MLHIYYLYINTYYNSKALNWYYIRNYYYTNETNNIYRNKTTINNHINIIS